MPTPRLATTTGTSRTAGCEIRRTDFDSIDLKKTKKKRVKILSSPLETDFIGQIENPFFDLRGDFSSRIDKSLKRAKFSKRCDDVSTDVFDVGSCLRRCFHEYQSVLTSKCFSLFYLYLTSIRKVTSNDNTLSLSLPKQKLVSFVPFVSNQRDHHVGIGMLSSIFQPTGQMIEGITSISEKNDR